MRNSLLILAAATSLSGLLAAPASAKDKDPRRGLEPVHVPVVSRQDFLFDVPAPDGGVSSLDAARLDGWFRGLDVGYGDNIYIQGDTGSARSDIARVASRYGLLVTDGGPVLIGALQPGAVRVVVSRTRATVPGCPNWSDPSEPNFTNHQQSNFGCGVNTNMAAMIANPEDFVHGREGNGVIDTQTLIRAVQSYRAQKPTGEGGLKDISTKGN